MTQFASSSRTSDRSSCDTTSPDRSTTAAVRRAIVADKDLSTYAHNIKIITTNGTVTLKGPVKSEEEKQKVLKDAQSAVSQTVVDELTVKQ